MNELDFIEALSDRDLTKVAGLVDSLKSKSPEILAALVGAGVLGSGVYLSSRIGSGGKLSAEQRAARTSVEATKSMERRAKEDKRPLSFSESLLSASSKSLPGYADALTAHPVKGALLFAPAGALAGLQILKALKPK